MRFEVFEVGGLYGEFVVGVEYGCKEGGYVFNGVSEEVCIVYRVNISWLVCVLCGFNVHLCMVLRDVKLV